MENSEMQLREILLLLLLCLAFRSFDLVGGPEAWLRGRSIRFRSAGFPGRNGE